MAYIQYLLETLPNVTTSALDDLLPWSPSLPSNLRLPTLLTNRRPVPPAASSIVHEHPTAQLCVPCLTLTNRLTDEDSLDKHQVSIEVRWHNGKWEANITFNKRKAYIGRFDQEMDAARAYDVKSIELFADPTRLNVPWSTGSDGIYPSQSSEEGTLSGGADTSEGHGVKC
jgi:hypothetical protein